MQSCVQNDRRFLLSTIITITRHSFRNVRFSVDTGHYHPRMFNIIGPFSNSNHGVFEIWREFRNSIYEHGGHDDLCSCDGCARTASLEGSTGFAFATSERAT